MTSEVLLLFFFWGGGGKIFCFLDFNHHCYRYPCEEIMAYEWTQALEIFEVKISSIHICYLNTIWVYARQLESQLFFSEEL